MIAPGSRFRKVKGEPEDAHKIGAEGKIIQAAGPMPEGEPFAGEYGYIVRFDGDTFDVFIRGAKIEEASSDH